MEVTHTEISVLLQIQLIAKGDVTPKQTQEEKICCQMLVFPANSKHHCNVKFQCNRHYVRHGTPAYTASNVKLWDIHLSVT